MFSIDNKTDEELAEETEKTSIDFDTVENQLLTYCVVMNVVVIFSNCASKTISMADKGGICSLRSWQKWNMNACFRLHNVNFCNYIIWAFLCRAGGWAVLTTATRTQNDGYFGLLSIAKQQ